jgi:hypothetical protein
MPSASDATQKPAEEAPKPAEPTPAPTAVEAPAQEEKSPEPTPEPAPEEKKEKNGVIDMSESLTPSTDSEAVHNLFAEALEATAAEPAHTPAPEVAPAPEKDTQNNAFSQINASFTSPAQSSASAYKQSSLGGDAQDPDLPDVSSEIKRILQERWITLANEQMDKLAKRRDDISAQLSDLEAQQRELTTKKQALENERVEILHSSESWTAKLKEAQVTLDKVVQEVSSI